MKNYQQKSVESNATMPETKTAHVTNYMTKANQLITFTPDMEIMNVIETLLDNKITGAPVLNQKGELIGLIDDKDCLKVLFDSAYHNQPVDNHNVEHYMSNVMKTISVHADIYEVANLFLTTIYKRLLVLDDDGKLVGQISRHDVLRAINDIHTR